MNIVRLTRVLMGQGAAVSCVAAEGNLVGEFRAAGGVFLPLDAGRSGIARLARNVGIVRRILSDGHFDIVHSFSATGSALVLLAKIAVPAVRRPPTVVSVMGLQNNPKETRLVTYSRLFVTVVGSKRVLVISPAIEAALLRLPIRRRRLARQHVVGVDAARVSDAHALRRLREELSIADGTRVVITIGRLDPTKSHDLFIEAARIVLKTHPEALCLVVGEGGERPALEALIATTGDERRIRLIGDRRDVMSLLELSAVCVRPGIVEGFVGITVLEAQSLAVPVVAFETQDVKLAIEHGVTGLLVPQGDTRALAEAIVSLLDDHTKAAALGVAGRAAFLKRFELTSVARRLYCRYLLETGAINGCDNTGPGWTVDSSGPVQTVTRRGHSSHDT